VNVLPAFRESGNRRHTAWAWDAQVVWKSGAWRISSPTAAHLVNPNQTPFVANDQYPQWGAGGRELFYVSPERKLMVVSLKTGANSVEPSAPRELFPLPITDIGLSPYDATPDGQRFLVRASPAQMGQPLTVIVNWPALMKKEAGAQ